VNEVIEMATAASANASAILLDARNSGLVRCHAAHIKKASSMPMPQGLLKVISNCKRDAFALKND
jgi:hypothetical protein